MQRNEGEARNLSDGEGVSNNLKCKGGKVDDLPSTRWERGLCGEVGRWGQAFALGGNRPSFI